MAESNGRQPDSPAGAVIQQIIEDIEGQSRIQLAQRLPPRQP